MDEHVHWRAKVAYMSIISQMLIYNTYSTHHNTKTTTIRNSKEHETPFLLYQGLNIHGDARLKIKTDQEIPRTGGGGKGGGGGKREDNDNWLSHWTTLNDANKACSLLLRSWITGNCKCSRAGVHSRHWVM